VFAVRAIDVVGAPPAVAREVRSALSSTRGTSLLKLDLGASLRRVEALPTVASARFDRYFPHTLRVYVRAERPVGVVRRGADSYLVAESGRVIAAVDRRALPSLPRIWANSTVPLRVGDRTAGDVQTAVTAAAPLAASRLAGRVSSVTATPDVLSLHLRSGLELRLGDPLQIPLKLAVAASVIPLLDPGTTYLDLSVPERPVSGTLNSQVKVQSSPSTKP